MHVLFRLAAAEIQARVDVAEIVRGFRLGGDDAAGDTLLAGLGADIDAGVGCVEYLELCAGFDLQKFFPLKRHLLGQRHTLAVAHHIDFTLDAMHLIIGARRESHCREQRYCQDRYTEDSGK